MHFQIDREEAPFHPYWPFSGEDQRKSGLSFFDATSAGLGKSDGIKYTIHPMHFLHQHLNFSAPAPAPVVVDTPKEEPNTPESVLVSFEKPKPEEPIIEHASTQEQEINVSNPEPNISQENTQLVPISPENIPPVEENTAENTQPQESNNPPEEITPPENIVEGENIPVAIREEIAHHELELLSTLSVDNFLSNTDYRGIEDMKNEISDIYPSASETPKEMTDEELLAAITKSLVSTPIAQEDKNPIIARMPDSEPIVSENRNTIFVDIPDNHPYAAEIAYLKARNIISGFVDNTFRPKNNITRIEALKIILLTHQSQPLPTTQTYFSDVKADSWENGYVALAIQKGIVDGNNRNFSPFRSVSRAEALKLIFTLGNIPLEDVLRVEIADISSNDWEYKYAQYAIENGLFTLENGKFFPSKSLTREELARLVYQYLR